MNDPWKMSPRCTIIFVSRRPNDLDEVNRQRSCQLGTRNMTALLSGLHIFCCLHINVHFPRKLRTFLLTNDFPTHNSIAGICLIRGKRNMTVHLPWPRANVRVFNHIGESAAAKGIFVVSLAAWFPSSWWCCVLPCRVRFQSAHGHTIGSRANRDVLSRYHRSTTPCADARSKRWRQSTLAWQRGDLSRGRASVHLRSLIISSFKSEDRLDARRRVWSSLA